MAPMEGFLFIDFDQRAFPRPEGGTLVDVAEQRVAGAIIEGVGDNKFDPAIQWYIKSVGIFEMARLALKDQLFCIDTQVTPQAIGDVRVDQLILDDREGRAEIIERGCVDGGVVVRRGAN